MASRIPITLLSVVSNIERHKLARTEPFLLLMDLAYPPDVEPAARQHLRFARNIDDVTFDANDGLGPQLYTAFNFTLGDVKVSTDGAVPESELQASNILGALQAAVEQYAGGVGALLELYYFNPLNPSGEMELALSFSVKSTTSDAKLVHLKLGAESPIRKLFPRDKYRPNACIWTYNSPALQAAAAAALAAGNTRTQRGAQCGYQGSLMTCSKTIDGPNGCQAHNNLIRIGTFPGIDSNGDAVAGVI